MLLTYDVVWCEPAPAIAAAAVRLALIFVRQTTVCIDRLKDKDVDVARL
jgi:hypothetical protein